MEAAAKQQLIDTYNQHAPAFQQKFADIGPRVEDIERGLSFVHTDEPHVLEIGCACGREAAEILKYTPHYTGIDIVERFIALARQNVPQAECIVADIETYQLPPNIDLIFAFASLIHVDRHSLRDILQRAAVALAAEGVVYLSMKYGSYQQVTTTDELGTRTHYTYTEYDIAAAAAGAYDIIWQERQMLRDQEWLTVALRKKS